jgi:nitric oxide reductase NorQ protein
LVKSLNRPDFYFNLGATQDPRATLIGNTHFDKQRGTFFSESAFVKAIKTPNSIILLDELSRAHPEAWNILMTVLDAGQRYLRLDEAEGSPIVKVAEGVTFIATANIGTDYTATRVMDRALVDRFIIIEMEALDAVNEASLLKMLHPNLDNQIAADIAEIAAITRKECRSESPKLTSAVSTRLCVEIAGLIEDGFSLGEAAEVCIYPFFDDAGGLDSERTYVKQVVQKYCGAKVEEDIFNTGAPVNSNMPF